MEANTTLQLVTDPVCKMQFTADKAAAWIKFNGQIFYFCHSACLHVFEADPWPYFQEAIPPEGEGRPSEAG
ncbi:MAG: YHS domain-containing protein [Chloroflexi bacterium]|nr:YHS domain-containing protein [Chloroflexota bacterium]MBI3762004.1 YHS domain-containing protein [Chloroflexota bacterium]